MSPKSPISPETISGKGREKESSNSGISLDTGLPDSRGTGRLNPVLPPHPLDHPGVVRIALGFAASEALKGLGKHVLIIGAMADATAPEHAQGRMVLHCLPITKQAADDAYKVAKGSHRAARNRVAKP